MLFQIKCREKYDHNTAFEEHSGFHSTVFIQFIRYSLSGKYARQWQSFVQIYCNASYIAPGGYINSVADLGGNIRGVIYERFAVYGVLYTKHRGIIFNAV